jgi:flagellin
MTTINTNVNAQFAHNALTVNSRVQSQAMAQLSTGKRINSARDDAAGLAMTETMTSQIRGLNVAVRNANDGISLLQTAEGAMIEQSNMLQRMRELAVQASTDTTTTSDKASMDLEYQALLAEVDRIGETTQWNGEEVLNADGGADSDGVYNFQVGASSGQSFSVTIDQMTTGDKFSDLDGTDLTDSTNAGAALDALDTAIANVAAQRANLGATMNRLTYAADNLANVSQNATESRARILDTDYATATTALSRSQIISQAATAMLAQANQQQQSVLQLLK